MALKIPAIADAYRKVVVTTGTGSGGLPGTATSQEVGGELNLDAGFGISLITDELNNKVTIVNTGNGTGALTTITENNKSGTFYPIFTRSPPGTQTFTVSGGDFTSGDIVSGVAEVRVTGSSNSVNGITAPMRASLVGMIQDETFSLIRVSNGAVVNFTATGPATYSTINGYWSIPVTVAPLVTDTFVSLTIATGAGELNPLTGTYQMDTMYLDQTTTPLTYNPVLGLMTVNTVSVVSDFAVTGHVTLEGVTSTGATGTGKIVFDNAPTITGHATIEGVTATGATGTGKFVFDTSPSVSNPTITGHATIEGQTLTGVTGTGKLVLDNAPTISGHPTVEGVTSTGATGTGKFVFDGSPTLVTPTLGVATATSVNKMAITAPATGSTLAVEDGKTFTVKKTITLDGTDSTTITLPATTGTVALNNQQFYIGTTQIAINRASATLTLSGVVSEKSTNIVGGNNTTLLGSLPYQSNTDATSLLAPNTSTTRNFLRMTGTGTNGAVPSWDTVTQTDVGLSNVTNESKATMFTDPTFTGTVSLAPATFESVSVSATAATGTVNVSVKTNTVFYYTSSATANWTFNFRGDGSTTLDAYLSTGKSITVVFLVTQGVTAFYPTAFTADGSAVTPKWLSGTAPTGGNASSIDSYSFTIIKTAAATYTILASQARFA